MPNKFWRDDELAVLVEMTEAGATAADIARALNRSFHAVTVKRRRLVAAGVVSRPKRSTCDNYEFSYSKPSAEVQALIDRYVWTDPASFIKLCERRFHSDMPLLCLAFRRLPSGSLPPAGVATEPRLGYGAASLKSDSVSVLF